MKKKNIRKALSLALSAVMLGGVIGSAASCGATQNSDGGTEEAAGVGITLWTTDAQEKVLQNYTGDIPELTPLTIEMAKGEYEGAQVVFLANEDIDGYTVEVSRLTNGKAYIPEENVSVYMEKYLEITTRKGTNPDFKVGSMVPDALLPMDVAVEYGENVVKEGNTQAIYVEVQTLADTAPGVYTGTVTVRAKEGVYNVPVSLTVWDFEVPATPSTKNYLSRFSRDNYASFEFDSSDYMDTVYFEEQLKYRMNCYLPFNGVGGEEKYVELLRKYYNWAGFSIYNVYYEVTSQIYDGMTVPFNVTLLKTYLKAIVKASLEDNVNYLDKAIFYFCNIIDEPSESRPGSFEKVQNVNAAYKKMLLDVNAELEAELVGYDNYSFFLETVSETLVTIPNVLPLNKPDSVDKMNSIGADAITPCIELEFLYNQDQRDHAFADDLEGDWPYEKEDWFYTCVSPKYPYPTTHIDDYLLGSRLMSWMQKAYDMDGYLNWAINDYLWDNYSEPVDDPYTETMRGDYVPGDGFLFYPGAPYGIIGPVGSLRAVSYRDGMEDYEYLNMLDEIYTERGLDSQAIEDTLYASVFSEVTPITDRDVFYATRRELAEMILLCSSDHGVLYEDIVVQQGKAIVRFNTYNEDATVSYKGEQLVKEAGSYQLIIDLSKETTLVLSVTFDGKTVETKKVLSGLYQIAIDFEDGKTDGIRTRTETPISINTDTQYVSNGNQSLRIDLTGKVVEGTYEPFFSISAASLNGGNLSELQDLTLSIYNTEAETVELRLSTFVGDQYLSINDYELAPGWNYLQIKVSTLSRLDKVNGFYFFMDNILTEEGEAGVKTVYLDEIAYTKK
ncbi:MAG: DUF4091 domain-containing protein [Clostridia bacterium]|nr:DUF4091 domain-containing protein [Clostridia bacterium]